MRGQRRLCRGPTRLTMALPSASQGYALMVVPVVGPDVSMVYGGKQSWMARTRFGVRGSKETPEAPDELLPQVGAPAVVSVGACAHCVVSCYVHQSIKRSMMRRGGKEPPPPPTHLLQGGAAQPARGRRCEGGGLRVDCDCERVFPTSACR